MKKNTNDTQDIFISYRRRSGIFLAILIKENLVAKGFSAFMDIDGLRSGKFNEKIYTKIDNATDFIVVLTGNCLERCQNENDWVRKEIVYAIKKKKNIIPVFSDDFNHNVTLPSNIDSLLSYNGVDARTELFEESMNRLADKFLKSKPKIPVNPIWPKLFYATMSVLIVFIIVSSFITYLPEIRNVWHKLIPIDGDHFDFDLNTQWFMKTTTGPSKRKFFAMAYDPENKYTILQGGFGIEYQSKFVHSQATTLSDTWIWQNNKWEKFNGKGYHVKLSAIAYDRTRKQLIMLGGEGTQSTYKILSDTRYWNGDEWKLFTRSGPDNRNNHAMEYDEVRNSIIMFGGLGRSCDQFGNLHFYTYDDTWEFKDSLWTKIDVEGPEPRGGHKMVFDERNQKIVLFGGQGKKELLNDTWLWDGSLAKWTKVETLKSPSPRQDFGMVYDSIQKVVLLFGGKSKEGVAVNDLWMWNGEEWKLIEKHSPPQPRYGHGMVYDEYNDEIIIYGGNNLTETWTLKLN